MNLIRSIGIAIVLVAGGCASVPRTGSANGAADYVTAHRELTADLSRAIRTGRLLLGMSPAQVVAAIGQPDRRTRFDATGGEVWLYRAGRAHLTQLPDGVQAFRIAFNKDRLVLIEPF